MVVKCRSGFEVRLGDKVNIQGVVEDIEGDRIMVKVVVSELKVGETVAQACTELLPMDNNLVEVISRN